MAEELFLDKKRENFFSCLAHKVCLWISKHLSTAKKPGIALMFW